MKYLFSLLAMAIIANFSYAQNSAFNSPAAGVISYDNFNYNGLTVSHYGLGWYQDPSNTPPSAFLSAYGGIRFITTGTMQGIWDANGNFGIGTLNPLSLFQVDDGCTKANIGDASGSSLNYGTSYLGFNAARNGSSWTANTDGVNNGGGVIYSDIFGNMNFIPINSTGGGVNKVISDADIRNNIALQITSQGIIHAKKVIIQTGSWADYVFEKDYKLPLLSDVKNYIDQNHHLPDMPSEQQAIKDGVDVSEMNKLLLKKVEELTLYLIEKDKKERQMQLELSELKKQFNKIKNTTSNKQ